MSGDGSRIRRLRSLAMGAAFVLACAGCEIVDRNAASSQAGASSARAIDPLAESYVRLALDLGEHDADYVDAYYGPEGWRQEAKASKKPLGAIRGEAIRLIADLHRLDLSREEKIVRLRRDSLVRQLKALATRCEMVEGKKLPFDEESKALYDAVAPRVGEDEFLRVLGKLDKMLPGRGALGERYEIFKKAFVVPPDRLDAVFIAAIREARRRTLAHIRLPENESFTVEYVAGKPWSGYNWYKGNSRSVIQVNTDLPTYVDRAVDLAAHEGYPGHHVYNALLESHLAKGRGWIEFTVYPLFSPQSLIAEGSANFGIEMVFPGEERVDFERQVIFPLAGLDPHRAGIYHDVLDLIQELDYATNEAGRRFLAGQIDASEAAAWLTRYTLAPKEYAQQRIRFIERYRSYVINYNLGRDLVRRYIESRGGTPDQPDRRWEEFEKLLSTPRFPSGLFVTERR
ncbi:MAG TPA: hypothetical protein VGR38_10005 [Candidatus Polarisedimenticolia bacterium]|jgi:hypothetical protein|nr:hypothetical protein [Candidatus Polarisedimenticolia bacterium]